MKKVALLYVLAVFIPSLVLAWLAVRSLRDQQFILERQQSLLYQGVADSLAKETGGYLADRQHEFVQQVEAMLAGGKVQQTAVSFDSCLKTNWPLAEVGFSVTVSGDLLCPAPFSSAAAQSFCNANGAFLANKASAEVYWNFANNSQSPLPPETNSPYQYGKPSNRKEAPATENNSTLAAADNKYYSSKSGWTSKSQLMRNVVPQQQGAQPAKDNDSMQYSKVAASEAEFRQLIGESSEGILARFLENKLNLLIYYRPPSEPKYIFGASLSLPRLKEGFKEVVQELPPELRSEVVAVLLDDSAKPVALSQPNFIGNWKHPFVATEIGESLPHWEVGVYLLNPAKLKASASALKLTLSLLIVVLVLAIVVGGWLIVSDLNRQLTLARQKTDFVSNVSHELKTPLTSIRMFSELLAEGRVTDTAKQQSYLHIISAEAARLTRLINNVLDFSRIERGEKKYNLQRCDLSALVAESVETYRPHLESNGFALNAALPPAGSIFVNGDRDALSQIVVNLLSNAEKYSGGKKEILVELESRSDPLPHAELRVSDRGLGVPTGCEEKIFEKFYRAHDSLSSGVQGSGLGLTLARQIARTHGGDVVYKTREGGGSCFCLRLPVINET